MDSKIDTVNIFKRLLFLWQILGSKTNYNKYLIGLYNIFVNIFATFAFPLHLLLGVIFASDKETVFTNLAIGISSIACTAKHLTLRPQLSQIISINKILQNLDQRVQNEEDTRYYMKNMRARCSFMINFFTVSYFSVSCMAVLTALTTANILYPAYVIVDWQNSTWKYLAVLVFQTYGLKMQIVQNLTNDVYGPMILCMLSGHIHLLSRRISRIGHERETEGDRNYEELVLCIDDYKVLMKQVERIISPSYMVQFTAVGINVVIGLLYLLFFADNLFAYCYYIFHILAIMIEIFPCCYYGSMVHLEFHALSYAIFRSNWTSQSRTFRRAAVTLTELTLRDVIVSAGGMITLDLDSFFKTCKMGYSIFTGKHTRYLRIVYDFWVNFAVTFGFTGHVIVGFFLSTNKDEFFNSLVISVACINSVMKHYILRYFKQEVWELNEIISQLDDRVRIKEDYDYYKRYIERPCKFMMRFFFSSYSSVSLTALMNGLATGDLLYPGYLPLPWRTSSSAYAACVIYQFYGVSMEIVKNLGNDLYGPLIYCMLSGHVHLLANRVSRVAHDNPENVEDNYKELCECIEDHKMLMNIKTKVERINSAVCMVQFFGVGVSLCIGLIYLLFFADNLFAYIYYSVHSMAIMTELFPCCYFGNMLECEYYDLSYAIFRSNWTTQPRPFRRNVVNFTELTLKEVSMYAGGMFRINLDTFFATCKMGYSFFTVVQSMK
ncbi:odorant receptor 33b-like [Bactrocera dorsalis]|uniref:Odorant receptor 33b-like n=1 Tax=Bactrocera dorsalis TaxID=27457 RepID=A0ABM3K6Y0_BACDO|nr:odorant receptor 33b-like [Bactrocera dorsalis]